MTRSTYFSALLFCSFLALSTGAAAKDSPVPEPFQGFDPNSPFSISYDDVTELLSRTVLNMGRSNREKSGGSDASTGTRIKRKVKRSTANEGNRFFFETYTNNPENRQLLRDVQRSLETIPDEAPLKYFSRDEQLAYWLNLYNLTMLNEIVDVYPKRSLKKLLTGKKSILSKKILTVAGVPLSLNDIQYTILKNNYDSNPLIIYGLYQGIVGGPNIRKSAYTGENVYDKLYENAVEFTNSNRGTATKDERTFRVSSLYKRNQVYFKNFEKDVKEHLLKYVEGRELGRLQAAAIIKPDINDWSVTDLYGSKKMIGNSAANNPAALIGSVKNTSVVDGAAVTTSMSVDSANLVLKAPPVSRFSPELLVHLQELDLKRKEAAAQGSSVTIDDLADDSFESQEDAKDD